MSRKHTLVRYDQRGCGLSDREVAEISFEAWLHDLNAVIDASGAERFVLLGISQGASIAVAYAVAHPKRVTRLILYRGYARGKLKRQAGDAIRDEAETLVKLAELGWGQHNPAFRQLFTTQFIPGGTPELQTIQKCRNHDFRHRIDASYSQGSVQLLHVRA